MELYDQPVRASPRLSAGFTLPMASSPRFGSYPYDYNFALLTLGFPKALGEDPLASRKDKLVGSFFNRHAVTEHLSRHYNLLVASKLAILFRVASKFSHAALPDFHLHKLHNIEFPMAENVLLKQRSHRCELLVAHEDQHYIQYSTFALKHF